MSRISPCGLEQKDRAGPVLLLFLLASAFLPSVFIEFDISRLFAAIDRAMARETAPVRLVLPAKSESPTALADIEASGLVVSVEARDGLACARPDSYPGRYLSSILRESFPEWPPGPASSPRAPPPST
jgi:hypothetical protein